MSDEDHQDFFPQEVEIDLAIREESCALERAFDLMARKQFEIMAVMEDRCSDIDLCVKKRTKISSQEDIAKWKKKLKSLDKCKTLLSDKKVLMKVFELALRMPWKIEEKDVDEWGLISEIVDVEEMFGPYYPKETWPNCVPYLNMLALVRYLYGGEISRRLNNDKEANDEEEGKEKGSREDGH